jgi:hypothetical protein
VLYLHDLSPNASPKAISGRTSYLQVRLAFHLYPQLIPHFCNSERFGLPRSITSASPWPWVAHLVSGLLPATEASLRKPTPSSDSLSLRLRVYSPLTSPQRVTRWLILQKARGQAPPLYCGERPPTACKHTVSGSISLRSPRFFSPFPHGTGSLSVAKGI